MKFPSIFLFLSLAAFSNCHKIESGSSSKPIIVRTYDELLAAAEHEGVPISQFGIKRNWNEVLAVAAMYGLEDKYRDQERENNALLGCEEDDLHEYFKNAKSYYDNNAQFWAYHEKGKYIQSLSDYFNLMDSLPLYRKHRYPSDEAYAALKKEYFASDYKFFINEAVKGPNNHVAPFLIVVTKPEEMPEEKARRIDKR